MADFGGALGSIGGAVSDLFGASGSSKAAGAYTKAADIATSNAQLTERSTAIQTQQQEQQTYKVLGTEQAATAAAGFTMGGSALDLLRSSTQQAALSKELIQNQGEITAQGYQQQAAAYQGQAQAAKEQAKGQGAGGILGAVAGVAKIAAWVICTEFMKQGRLPKKYWVKGSRIFANYPDAVKEGYHVWAVPSVVHIRRHPYSLYSRLLCCLFNWRAENIAAHAGVPGARRLVRGAMVTAVLWPLCYALGWARLKSGQKTDWEALYHGG